MTGLHITHHVRERYEEHHALADDASILEAIQSGEHISKENAFTLSRRRVRTHNREMQAHAQVHKSPRISVGDKRYRRRLKPSWIQQHHTVASCNENNEVIKDIFILTHDKRGIFVIVEGNVVCTYLRLPFSVTVVL